MASYKCIKRLYNFEGEPILEIDRIYDIPSTGFQYYEQRNMKTIDIDYLTEGGFVKIVEDQLDIKVLEVPETEFEMEKNYRIQLDVRTTKKKLLEIEAHLRQTINDFL